MVRSVEFADHLPGTCSPPQLLSIQIRDGESAEQSFSSYDRKKDKSPTWRVNFDRTGKRAAEQKKSSRRGRVAVAVRRRRITSEIMMSIMMSSLLERIRRFHGSS
jgi:hypothetical protein